MDANFTTTVNGETTVHSAEAAQHVFSVGFLVIFIVAIFQSFWNYRYDEEKTNTIASGVFLYYRCNIKFKYDYFYILASVWNIIN